MDLLNLWKQKVALTFHQVVLERVAEEEEATRAKLPSDKMAVRGGSSPSSLSSDHSIARSAKLL